MEEREIDPHYTYLRSALDGKPVSHADGFHSDFATRLSTMFQAMPEHLRDAVKIFSGYRDPGHQARLYKGAVKKYGSPSAARKWVAPPGKSYHNHGTAADLRYMSPEARKWAHENAKDYGLKFPMKHEPWHVELVNTRGGGPLPPLPNQVPLPEMNPAFHDTGPDFYPPLPTRGPDQTIAEREAPESKLIYDRLPTDGAVDTPLPPVEPTEPPRAVQMAAAPPQSISPPTPSPKLQNAMMASPESDWRANLPNWPGSVQQQQPKPQTIDVAPPKRNEPSSFYDDTIKPALLNAMTNISLGGGGAPPNFTRNFPWPRF